MVNEHQTKEALLKEFRLLQHAYDCLKASSEKEIADLSLMKEMMESKLMNSAAVFESSPVAMLIIDETTNIVMVNLAAVKLCGGNESELIKHRPGNALRCVHSNKDPRGCGYAKECKICAVRIGVEAIIAKGGTISGAEVEMELSRCEKPEKVWMNVGVEPFLSDGRKFWCIAMEDITEHKKTEHRLKESQTLLNSIIDSTNDMIWSVDADHFGLLQWNASFHDYFLMDRGIEIAVGMTPEDLFPVDSEYIPFWKELFHLALEKGSSFKEYETYSKTRIFQINLELLVQNGRIFGISIFAKNITAQKKAEIELKESKEQLASIVNSTSDMIWSVDAANFGLLTYNKAFVDYFLKVFDTHIEKGMPPGMLPTSEMVNYWKDIYQKGMKGIPFEAEYTMLTSNRTLNLSINPLFHDNVLAGLSVFAKDITAQKQAEEKIHLSEEKFRTAFMTINDGFLISTLNEGIVIEQNIGFENIFQYTPKESIGKTSSELRIWAVPEDRTFMISQLQEQGYCNNLETIGRRKNGELFNVSVSTSILNIDHVPHIVGVLRDITERKQAEVALIKSDIRFREVLENSQDASYKRNIQTNKYEYLSPVFYQITGFTPEEINSLPLEEVTNMMHPSDLPEINHILSAALSGSHDNGFQVEYRFKHKIDGKYHWLLDKFTVMHDDQGTAIAMIGSVSEISKRKEIEMELIGEKEKTEQNESRLKLATASGQLGIWDWDLVENTMLWDDRMFELYGITREAFPNNIHAWTNGLHPEDKQKAIEECYAALNGEGDYNTSFRVLRPDGKVWQLRADATILRDGHGKPMRMIGINRDITDAKLAEEQLMVAKDKAEESDRLKSAFLANMSHEIRTPLNGILGFSELLNDPDFDQEQKNEFTKSIIENGNNLLVIINDILDFSMLEAQQIKIKKTLFSVHKMFIDLKKEFSPKVSDKGLQFQVNFPSGYSDLVIENDFYRIKQIFNNLIGNALKFTSSGFIEIGFLPAEGSVKFYVRDTGIGIALQFHEDIFERFRQVDETKTRKYGGNGLGLAISKNLVEILGGSIWVESEVGKGSTFLFEFPNG